MNAANAGDVNADGFSDLIGAGRDQVRVWFGGSSPNPVPDLTLARTYASVAGAGDVNGDGIDDFVVGAAYDRWRRPCVRLLWWKRRRHPRGPVLRWGSLRRSHRPMRRGWGHVDGPGPSDLIASAYWDPEAIGYNKGRVYVFGNSFRRPPFPRRRRMQASRFVGPRPNPARNEVNLVLELDHAVPVRVTVFDLAGHEVARPIADEWLAGRVSRAWRPIGLASGVYYLRAELEGREQVRKVVWLGIGADWPAVI